MPEREKNAAPQQNLASPMLTAEAINAAKEHLSREVGGALTNDELTFYVSASVQPFLAAQDREKLAWALAERMARVMHYTPHAALPVASALVAALLGPEGATDA